MFRDSRCIMKSSENSGVCRSSRMLRDEDFGQWKESRKAAEQLAVDYTATVGLYLGAVRTVFPKSSN